MRARVKTLVIVACHGGEAAVFAAVGMPEDVGSAALIGIFLLGVVAIAAAVHRVATRDARKYAGYLEDEGSRWLDEDVLAGMKKDVVDGARSSKSASSICCTSFVIIMIAGMIIASIDEGISWTSVVMAGVLIFSLVLFSRSYRQRSSRWTVSMPSPRR